MKSPWWEVGQEAVYRDLATLCEDKGVQYRRNSRVFFPICQAPIGIYRPFLKETIILSTWIYLAILLLP